MRIYYLTEELKLWGKHTGYLRLPHYMRQIVPEIQHFQIQGGSRIKNFLGRFLGNYHTRERSLLYRNFYEWYFYYFITLRFRSGSVYHLLNFDGFYSLMARFDKAPKRIISTLHNPRVTEYSAEFKKYLSRLSSAVILYRRDIEWYESFVGKGRVKFVPLGVDTDFFRPNEMKVKPEHPRLFFVGRVFRDTAMLARLIETMIETMPQVRFDVLVTQYQIKHDPNIKRICDIRHVKIHSGISDAALLHLYQQSYLLLMPLVDSGANTALCEALASGLPVVTQDVGGVPDYGGGTVFPTAAPGSDEAMLALIERYLDDFRLHNEVAAAGRDFAVSHLAWPIVAQRHYEIYEELCL